MNVFKILSVFRSGPWQPLLPDYWNLARSSLLSQLCVAAWSSLLSQLSPTPVVARPSSVVLCLNSLSFLEHRGLGHQIAYGITWGHRVVQGNTRGHLWKHHVTYGSMDGQGLTFVVNIKTFFLFIWVLAPVAPERSDSMNHIFTKSQPLI